MKEEKHPLLKKLSPWLWEIPAFSKAGMHVPCHVYASEALLEKMKIDHCLDQLMNVASLPGIVRAAMMMPDAHEGYGFPVGGVAATRYPNGIISPGGIGYDINCGVRLLRCGLMYKDLKGREEELAVHLFEQIPSGTGKGGVVRLNEASFEAVLRRGSQWAVDNGYGIPKDLAFTESGGRMKAADPGKVSEAARMRGMDQLGSIGSGNHFVEVGYVEKVFDQESAEVLGLKEGMVTTLIHTGSRGLGHQVATDHISIMLKALPRFGIVLTDKELACAPLSSPEGQDYYSAMCAAANFAWCNRQVLTWKIREALKEFFGKSTGDVDLVYDVAHNIAKMEKHFINGKEMTLIVHRKGATRAFGPHHDEVPVEYASIGQPVLIPGSMGTASYVLCGTSESMLNTFGSACHGAGRQLSRRAITRQTNVADLEEQLKKSGIFVRAGSRKGIAEEAPAGYKDIEQVVDTVIMAGLARKIARLKPVVVIKG